VVITEKLDGTNSAAIIEKVTKAEGFLARLRAKYGKPNPFILATVELNGEFYNVAAQSRNRLITPGKTTDNYGFARWVQLNAETLVRHLGEGRHFGEWWGQGIARKYGMDHKSFSLFNTYKYWDLMVAEPVGDAHLTVVPVMYEGEFSEGVIANRLANLRDFGSMAAPGFKEPEGICIFHEQSKKVFKVTLDRNDKGKWELV
jgi:hypothetical protein